MIAGNQQVNESAKASAVTPMKNVASRGEEDCPSRQIVVTCLPAVEFEVPIYFVDELQSYPSARLAPAEVGEF
jgi:hypothetical protein